MAEGAGDGSSPATGVKPGALSALLQEVAAAPEMREVEPVSLPPGTVVGRFEILRELGRGGFGVVYEARDRDLGRQVALKNVRSGRATEEEGKVLREAEAIARLTHPNLVTLYDVGRSESGPYLVFEFLRGKTLQGRMDEGPMPVQEAVHVATEVARGLAHAHAEGVVHRDLKPSNVFVTNKGQVKILDFGMAHAFGRRRISGGTPAYMAPEQWEDDPEDERTDVFALGVMLYRMLSGEYPFPEGEGRWAAEPATVRKLDVPGAPELADLVERMLDRTPKGRPREGAAVLAALTPIEDRLRAKTADGRPPEHAKRRKATFGDLLAELKRRHVFRVMIGYGFFAFAVLQVTEPIMHGAELPDWVLKAVLVALALGFPVAVVLAWIFDLTAHGVKRTPSDSSPGAPSFGRSRFLLPVAAAFLVLATVGAGAAGWYAWKQAGRRTRPAAAERTTVAVADFANDTRDPDLDGLSGLLITSLEQSKKLRVLTRSRLQDHLRAMGRSVDERVDEALGRDLGRQADIRALLLASVRKLGDGYFVELRALDPRSDEYLFTVSEQTTGKSGIVALIDRLSDRTRLALRETSGEVAASDIKVGEAITGSLEAYRHYFLSQQALDDHDFERAVAESKKALAIDPDMAPAHAWLAWLADFGVAGGEDANQHIQAAMKGVGNLPAKERRMVEALDLMLRRQPETGAAFGRLSEDYPQDKFLALFAARTAGTAAERRPFLEKALAIDPTFVWAVYHLPGKEMLPSAQRAVELRPDSFATQFNNALALGYVGRLDEALVASRRAQALARPARAEVDALVAACLAAKGRLPDAVKEMEPWLRPGVTDVNRRMALIQLVRLEALQGKRRAALRTLAEGQRIAVPPQVQGWEALYAGMGGDEEAGRKVLAAWKDPPPRMAWAFAEVGLDERAKALMAKLPPDDPSREPWLAASAVRAGPTAAAVERFSRFLDEREARDSHRAYVLGRLLSGAGRCEEAIVEFDRVTSLFPWAFAEEALFGTRMPLSLLEGARCQLKLGRPGEATARLDRLLAMWKDADPDLPALAEAKAMRARLGPPGGERQPPSR